MRELLEQWIRSYYEGRDDVSIDAISPADLAEFLETRLREMEGSETA